MPSCYYYEQVVSSDPEIGWLSIGFSADGEMIGSDAVVGSFEAGSVLEYKLGAKVCACVGTIVRHQRSAIADKSVTLASMAHFNYRSVCVCVFVTSKIIPVSPLVPSYVRTVPPNAVNSRGHRVT